MPGEENRILTARDRGLETGSILHPRAQIYLGRIPQTLPSFNLHVCEVIVITLVSSFIGED